MPRYFFELAYDGTDFFGWQRQPNAISVQEVIEANLSKIHSNSPIKVVGCGRTDTGVHAYHYVLHAELPEITDPDKFLFKLNRMLPESIAMKSVQQVDTEKHARFSATKRTYRYFIHQSKDPFERRYSWYVPQELNINQMNEGAKLLLGKKDFTSLSKLHTDVKTNICDVASARWIKTDQGLFFEISADRFLRNMVRATVGTLIDIGLGKLEAKDIERILAVKDRQAASTSVPAHGLFLWKIEYDD